MQLNLPVPERALAVGAHPDDVEFGCGGTLAKWAAAGCAVSHVVLTDGSKGSWDPAEDVADLVRQRQDEQRAAARALGATGEVIFGDWVDGELGSGARETERMAYWIRQVRPDVVLGHDPWRRHRLHPDHRHAGWVTCDGIVAARDPHFHPDHDRPPWRPSVLLLWEADMVDHVEDVATTVDAKLAALDAHVSQFRSTMGIEAGAGDPEQEAQRHRFHVRVRDRLAEFGRQIGVAYGEGFKRVENL